MQDAKLGKPFGYPYVEIDDLTYSIDSRFNIFYYTCVHPTCSIILPDLGSVMDSYSVFIKRTDTTDSVLTVYAQLGQTTNIGDSIELSANEEVYITANIDQWLVFRGGQLALQSIRFLDNSTPTTTGAIVYNTNPAFMSGKGYYGVSSLGAWFNLSAGGGGGTITTSAPLTGNGSGGNPATLDTSSSSGTVLVNIGGWINGQSYTASTTYVDSINGSDLTGQSNNPLFPFQTIDAAALAVDGPVPSIYVRAGNYFVTNSLTPINAINYYFEPGTVINCGYDGVLFDTLTYTTVGGVVGGNFILNTGSFINAGGTPQSTLIVDIESLIINSSSVNIISINNGMASGNINIGTLTVNNLSGQYFIYNNGVFSFSAKQFIVNASVTGLTIVYNDMPATQVDITCESIIYNGPTNVWFIDDNATSCNFNINVGSVTGTGTLLYGVYSPSGSGGVINSSFGFTIFDQSCYTIANKLVYVNDGFHAGPFFAENSEVLGSIQSVPLMEVIGSGSNVLNLSIGYITNFYIGGFNGGILNIGSFQPALLFGESVADDYNGVVNINSIISGGLGIVFVARNGSVVTFNILSVYTDLTSNNIFTINDASYCTINCPEIDCTQLLAINGGSTVSLNVPLVNSTGAIVFDNSGSQLNVSNSIIRDTGTPFTITSDNNTIIFQNLTLKSVGGLAASIPATPVYVYGWFTTNVASTNISFPANSENVKASII